MPTNVILFAYLSTQNPAIAWEIAIGRMRSTCDLEEKDRSFGISMWQYKRIATLLKAGLQTPVANELRLELVRQRHFPTAVSRLQGLYFFQDEASALAVRGRTGWPRFDPSSLSAVKFSATNLTEVDSEWITHYLRDESGSADWMHRYWSGETCGEHPLTEVLASGIGIVQNRDLREKAYRSIYEKWPESTSLLAAACCGFNEGMEDVAQSMPGITAADGNCQIDFYVRDIEEHAKALEPVVQKYIALGQFPPVVRPADPKVLFVLPNLQSLSLSFDAPALESLVHEAHEGFTSAPMY